jgi:hypothetical protein
LNKKIAYDGMRVTVQPGTAMTVKKMGPAPIVGQALAIGRDRSRTTVEIGYGCFLADLEPAFSILASPPVETEDQHL